MKEYYFSNGEFVIENYDKQRNFCSFLPSIAGKKGIPLWAFYVNRGQVMSSFGVKDKNGAILEFFPAYSAYEIINRIGFRTFIKMDGNVHEIFSIDSKDKYERRMRIKREEVSIEEVNKTLKLKVEVTYFTLPNENIASLIRKVKITSLSNHDRKIEVLDGLSQIFVPHTEHGTYKVMSNLLRSWMEVKGLEDDIAYYKYSSSTSDTAEVSEITEGNFYVSLVNNKITKPIVDPNSVFGYDNSYSTPINFINKSVNRIKKEQEYPFNKVLCGFTPVSKTLKANGSLRIDTLIGQIYSFDALMAKIPTIAKTKYIDLKQIENTSLIDRMTSDVKTDTANVLFNEYIESTYLDNMLRGGYPYVIKDNNNKENIYYLFSRKHGDPERDYNWFNIENEFYSQGNGNFRDICQNRRSDSYFNLAIKDYNLKYFMDLVQLDGYNPLGVNGATYSLNPNTDVDKLVNDNFVDKNDIMKNLLKGRFTPGSIINTQINKNIEAKFDDETYIKNILTVSSYNVEASFNEGYWCDHFTYLLDLYDSFIAIYPDKKQEVVFDDNSYMYFESPTLVQPRWAKTYLTPQGKIRQYAAIYEPDAIKVKAFDLKPGTNFAKFKNQETIKTNLASKLFLLAFLKFNLLDNQGIGIEMEGNKPGWNDACNGLPGLFGSSVGETFEVIRIVDALKDLLKEFPEGQLHLPKEFLSFVKENEKLLEKEDDSYYDKASTLREDYRELLRTGVSENETVTLSSLANMIDLMSKKLAKAEEKAFAIGNGICPTFLTYEVTDYEIEKDENGNEMKGYNGYTLVRPLKYKRIDMPSFLEGPARSLKVIKDKNLLKNMYSNVKASDIYDSELKMYKTSGSLQAESMEFGRIRAFNPGWLERESNFMHMNYKYLYGLLKAGLYDEFYEDIKTNLVCNMNPKVYGRSVLEHCSFIATSNNPDVNTHGQGFVARLSGSTSEMLSIYLLLLTGGELFKYENNELSFTLNPLISKEYFKKDHTLSTTLFSKIKLTYVNENDIDAFNGKVYSYVLKNKKVEKTVNEVVGQDALDVRNLKYTEIIAYIK